MRIFAYLLMASVVFCCGCKKEEQKPEKEYIITRKPVPEKQTGPITNDEFTDSKDVKWLDKTYTVHIRRYPDKELSLAKDEDGKVYYDNKVELIIKRPDDTEFYNRVFSKSNFSEYIPNAGFKDCSLLGIAFSEAKDDNLIFGVSIGSPDPISDQRVPLRLVINKMGDVSVSREIINERQQDTETKKQ
ncbi:MAG: DUF4738 domain-containing protein [Prevotella sp.]|nr:DUF4738 domain-containing protein [Prevotella sp.]MCR5153102.1 DUF4738 domain-containing protein [Prevotella sp.]